MNSVPQKVTPRHLQRDAYLYVRQSTLRQVLENTESTKRQYALRERAWLWVGPSSESSPSTVIWASPALRLSIGKGFNVWSPRSAWDEAGIVLGLEVSRLARNCSDWHRLLELRPDRHVDPRRRWAVRSKPLQRSVIARIKRDFLRSGTPCPGGTPPWWHFEQSPAGNSRTRYRWAGLIRTCGRPGSRPASATITAGLLRHLRGHGFGLCDGQVLPGARTVVPPTAPSGCAQKANCSGEPWSSPALQLLHNPRYAGASFMAARAPARARTATTVAYFYHPKSGRLCYPSRTPRIHYLGAISGQPATFARERSGPRS